MAFEIRAGDQRPHYRIQLTGNGDPVDLTGATSVTFLMKRRATGATVVNAAGAFIDRTLGLVEYAWGETDTALPGGYDMKVRIDWSGEPQTFPSVGSFDVIVRPDA